MTGQPDDRTRIRAAESRIEFIMAGLFTVLLFGTLAYVWSLFRPIAPANVVTGWTIMMGATIAVMGLVPLIYLLRNPDENETVRVWARVGKVVSILYDVSIAVSIWTLLPYASDGLRLLMVIFYISAICGQVLSTAESLEINAFGIITVFGSIAIFYLTRPGPYSTGIAVFLVAFGLLLFAVAVALRVAVRSTIVARLKAEDAAAQLADALQAAEAQRDARIRFMATTSHDLRQPLHAAMLFFEQTRSAGDEAIRDRAARGVSEAFHSANSILDSILEHLRITSGTIHPERSDVSLGQLFSKVVSLHEPEAESAGITLGFRPTRQAVHADPSLIERVIGNLISNAIRHSGGSRVLVTSRRRGDRIEIFALDNGRGIPDAWRDTVFDEYAQARIDPAATRAGLGLGLASARRLVELNGGRLALLPGAGRGAVFQFDLPAASLPQSPAGAASLLRNAGGWRARMAGKHILVVEDNRPAGEALAAFLRRLGASADWAGSLDEAARLAAGATYDAIVTDWHIGHGDTGGDVISLIRQQVPGLPALVVTGDGAPHTLGEIMRLGVPLLHKPAPPDSVAETIAGFFAES